MNFVPKFVAVATGVTRREIQMTTSDSLAPKIWRQVQTVHNYLLRGPSYSQFCPKIVAMATGVSRGKILMTPSDSAGTKIGG